MSEPRTLDTQQRYRRTASQLLARHDRERGTPWTHDPAGFVQWLDTLRGQIKPASWRQYRAALIHVCQPEHPDLAASIHALDSSTCQRRSTRTSARKLKRLPDKDLLAIYNYLNDNRHPFDALLGFWLMAAVATGLRPCEWQHAELTERDGIPALVVQNAKHTHDRAHGPTRTQLLPNITPESLRMVERLMDTVSGVDDAAFARYYRGCRDRLYYVNRRLWRRRKRYVTLYSARHQFIADAKSAGMSRTEIAALAGHVSPQTAGRYYAHGRSGRGAVQVAADPADMARVRPDTHQPFRPANREAPPVTDLPPG